VSLGALAGQEASSRSIAIPFHFTKKCLKLTANMIHLGVSTVGEYFRGWKRKVGVIALALACLFVVGWMRSRHFQDGFNLPSGVHKKDSFFSLSEAIVWARYDETMRDRPMQSGPFSYRFKGKPFNDPDIKWRWRWHGFGDGEDPTEGFRIWTYPYWAIVFPLTFVSCYLLLSQPGSKSSVPQSAVADASSRQNVQDAI
jgi:hypothetical protein